MDLEEIKKYLEENKDNNDVVDLIKSFQQPITRDVVEQWCQEGEGQSWLDRNCDIYSQKAVKTARDNAIAKFKKEELPKLIEDAVKAKSSEGLTPEQLKIKELEEKMARYEAEKAETLRLEANRNKLKEQGLSTELARFIKEDADIEFFKNFISNAVQAGVKEKLGGSNYKPPVTAGEPKQKMTLAEIMAYANENPGVNIQDLINQN